MRNDKLLDHKLNAKFEDILAMDKEAFRQWCIDIRKLVVKLWDEDGLPPRVGFTEAETAEQFTDMYGFTFKTDETVKRNFKIKDEHNPKSGPVVRNTFVLGNAVNDWFPTMMKTRINYTKDEADGKSIYDFFAQDTKLDTFITYASRHFHRDSFYAYSRPMPTKFDKELNEVLPHNKNAVEWILEYEKTYRDRYEGDPKGWDYWLCPIQDKEYTGYNEDLKEQNFLQLSYDEIIEINDDCGMDFSTACISNLDIKRSNLYTIRVYQRGQKLFPVGLKAWRVSFCQYAVNFPPLTAKFIYEEYTDHIKNQEEIVIYDPSMGWGGRLLGAMSYNMPGKHVTYVGTDPNMDHTVSPNVTKYDQIAQFFRDNVARGGVFALSDNLAPEDKHTYTDIFQEGSEVIRNHTRFQKYKGRVDLVFTSPPYFMKEAYSEDDGQSYKKFGQYDAWREGFLRPTLETAVEWLRSERYLLWNIADAKFGNDMLPLEEDSRKILLSLGMQERGVLKMALAQMPGGNRVDTETGLPKAKNFCKVEGIWLKYEPVFIYWKP